MQQGHRDLPVLPVQQEIPALRVHPVPQVVQAPQDLPEQTDPRVQQEIQGLRVVPVHRVQPALPEVTVQMEQRVRPDLLQVLVLRQSLVDLLLSIQADPILLRYSISQSHREQPDLRVQPERTDLRGLPAQRGLPVLTEMMERQGQQDLPERKGLPDPPVHPAQREQQVVRVPQDQRDRQQGSVHLLLVQGQSM